MPATPDSSPFLAALAAGGVSLSSVQQSKLQQFATLIEKHNTAFRLMSTRALSELWMRHLVDSLLLLSLPWPSSIGTVCDLGSGGGFPAVPLALGRPDLAVLALDRRPKKIDFLHRVKLELQLNNLHPWCGQPREWLAQRERARSKETRSEETRSNDAKRKANRTEQHTAPNLAPMQGRATELATELPLAQYPDLVIARAVAPLVRLLPLAAPLLTAGRELWAMKGPRWPEEMQILLPNQRRQYSAASPRLFSYPSLPGGPQTTVLCWERI